MSHELLSTSGKLLVLLDRWVRAGWLRALDRGFARFLQQQADAAGQPLSPLLLLAAALVSHQNGRGHVCLDIAQTLMDADAVLSLPPEGNALDEPPLRPSVLLHGISEMDWLGALQHALVIGSASGNSPLVLNGSRLYLRRFWQYEQQIITAITQRTEQSVPLDDKRLQEVLEQLFGDSEKKSVSGKHKTDWQKIACALAARSGFAVITGGPGTGKTTTVVKLLAVLQNLAVQENGRMLRIRLAAPTGKAAARLNDSISRQMDDLREKYAQSDNVCNAIMAEKVSTIHRLLGTLPDSRHFRHHAHNPLSVDVVVVDEASMVDVETMAKLLDALPDHARLILLGDKDQLASVEAGAVLGQLCVHAAEGRYRAETVQWVQAVTGESIPEHFVSADNHALLDQSVVMLRHSHRFKEDSGIGALSRAVNAGDVAGSLACLSAGTQDIQHLRINDVNDSALVKIFLDGYSPSLVLLQSRPVLTGNDEQDTDAFNDWAKSVLAAHSAFQLLCAVRRGDWGVENINRQVEDVLRAKGLIDGKGEWYSGRPVIVTRNDYGLRLMNGDMGVALLDRHGKLRVVFADAEEKGGVRWVLPARLADVDTAFAMTVHKSQGSEFLHAVLLLPGQVNPVLTRELLYTGITRAARQFTLVDSCDEVLHSCIQRQVLRVSGTLVEIKKATV
jgi:exodeoxyribonuclease V alpha subunit